MKFLLYGANGYTAQLMLPLAARYGLTPVLAGRSPEKIEPLAARFGLESIVFDLSDAAATDAALRKTPLVLHCAGPFSQTARPMLEACLRTGTHYLDITGEWQVFELAASLGPAAREKGILLLPGAGFDVVPTDCMALYLKNRMPDATALKLAFVIIGGGVSHGTARTAAESFGSPAVARRGGKIVPVPIGRHAMTLDFGPLKRFVMTVPWGDVSTAFYTTGIPDVEVFSGFNPKKYAALRWKRLFGWWFRSAFMQNRLRKKIDQRPAPGPTDAQREQARAYIWGQVENAGGEKIEARLETPEGYTLTAHSALMIARRVLSGDFKAGFWTPAGLFGENLVLEIPGAKFI